MHHRPDPFSHLSVVTMNAAVQAGRLLLLEGTEIKPFVAVPQQLVALGAKLLAPMFSKAVYRDHCRYGLLLPCYPT